MLALVPLDPFRELAFVMGVGIVLDAVVVRTFLVPTLLVLFGRWSWWPGRPGDTMLHIDHKETADVSTR